jgi:hypothetical protein
MGGNQNGGRLEMLKDKESGQSIIIIAAIVVVLLALVALVVDVGNAYAHRRMVQNAVDAGALAGARRLADRYIGEAVTELQILRDIETFAQENGLEREKVQAWFIDSEGEIVETVDRVRIAPPSSAEGVKVAGDLPFTTYFAHLLGFPRMTASTTANAWVLAGPCSARNLFPVIVSTDTFTDTETPGIPDVGVVYTLWDKNNKAAPGNFGWIYWEDRDGTNHCEIEIPDCAQGPQVSVLGPNITDNSRSGTWSKGDWIHGDVGVNMEPALDELAPYFEGNPQPTVYLPLFDEVQATGNNALYHIYAFAGFRLRCAFSSKNHFIEYLPGDCDPCNTGSSKDKCIRGEFVEMVAGSGLDGCEDTGVYIPSFRKPR